MPELPRSPNPLRWLWTLIGAVTFYTCLPIPQTWRQEFQGIARWATAIGLAIGGILFLLDTGLHWLGIPVLVRSALLVLVWVAITGGLHLDGAMDTADGLAVIDPARRLQVMSDSHSGAFGVMAAIAILLLKTVALAELSNDRGFALAMAAGWGRWGQLAAIVRYPYLKSEGKGAFHKAAVRSTWDALPSLLLLLGYEGLYLALYPSSGFLILVTTLGGLTIAFTVGAWFNHKLGGHTGDTYGAIVEWTEALLLCCLTA
ncbi:MAG TPA: adenosylcobinamide-GDP ribazoletransferase [Thermosynechococcaceae cyanobacterium]